MTAINEDTLYAVVIKRCLVLLAALTVVGFTGFSVQTGLGVLAGGVIAIVNFLWMRNALQRILGLLPDNPTRYALMRFLARMTILGIVLYYILTSAWFSVAGLLVGLSIVVVNIIAVSVYCALRTGG
jgi:ATP synthase I subunit